MALVTSVLRVRTHVPRRPPDIAGVLFIPRQPRNIDSARVLAPPDVEGGKLPWRELQEWGVQLSGRSAQRSSVHSPVAGDAYP